MYNLAQINTENAGIFHKITFVTFNDVLWLYNQYYGLVPSCARKSAGTVMTKSMSFITTVAGICKVKNSNSPSTDV